MTIQNTTLSSDAQPRPPSAPAIRSITHRDLRAALTAGLEDFKAAPAFGLVFGGFFALGGLIILACLFWLDLVYLAYPLAAGYALIGPFAAASLYEVSRRRELGAPLTWSSVFRAVLGQGRREIAWMAFVGVFILIVWMYQVRLLLALFLGFSVPPTLSGFVSLVLTTPDGLAFLVVGHLVGAGFALVTFALTVVACPLLLDQDRDFITAMITSVQAVLRNPGPMLVWAATVAGLLALGMAPVFLGLLVVLPVLGHATWHLYRKVVVPAQS
jgi:uncharacterized membrane protein